MVFIVVIGLAVIFLDNATAGIAQRLAAAGVPAPRQRRTATRAENLDRIAVMAPPERDPTGR